MVFGVPARKVAMRDGVIPGSYELKAVAPPPPPKKTTEKTAEKKTAEG